MRLIPNPGYRLFWIGIDENAAENKVEIEEVSVLGLGRRDTDGVENVWDNPRGTPASELGLIYADDDGVHWVHFKNCVGYVIVSPTENAMQKVTACLNGSLKRIKFDLRPIPEKKQEKSA